MPDLQQESSENLQAETRPHECDTALALEDVSTTELAQYLQQIRLLDRQSKSESLELREEISHLDKKLKERESQRRVFKKISKELELAQRFLCTADSLSQGEAVREMERLNDEILQLTSIMAYEYLQIGEKRLPTREGQAILLGRSPLLRKLGKCLDIIMAENLSDTSAMQIGWQTILAHWSSNIIQDLVLEGGNFEFNPVIRDMYRHIVLKNDPATARCWRSLMYGATSVISERRQRTMVGKALKALADLPVLWGYVFDQEVYNSVYKEFRRRFGRIIDQCLQLRAMLGQGITSVEIRPYVLASGTKYNPEQADLYEDGADETEEELGDVIACSTSLGLSCLNRSCNADGDFEEKTDPILKPRVILLNSLKKIIL